LPYLRRHYEIPEKSLEKDYERGRKSLEHVKNILLFKIILSFSSYSDKDPRYLGAGRVLIKSLDSLIGIDIHRYKRVLCQFSPARVYNRLWITIFGPVSADAHGIDKNTG